MDPFFGLFDDPDFDDRVERANVTPRHRYEGNPVELYAEFERLLNMSEFEAKPFFLAAKASGRPIVTDHPTFFRFDIDGYIANYKGKTRIDRLYHIGTTSTFLSENACKTALEEAKKGRMIEFYKKLIKTLHELSPYSKYEVDKEWVQETNKLIKVESDRLEAELKGYKNNLIKESIRMGYDDLGQHYHSIGDLANAAKSYNGMRQYCISPVHTAVMLFYVVHVSIDQQNWLAVISNCQKLKTLYEAEMDSHRMTGKVSAAMGLAEMASGNYKAAAINFLATDSRMAQAQLNNPLDEEAYNEVMTPNDVAVYGGLCALVSMNRQQLVTDVLENSHFRAFLELEPHIRDAIALFCRAKYSKCLAVLDSYRSIFLLDLYLYRHVGPMFDQIRRKSIVQYMVPISRVPIASMAPNFHVSEMQLEAELKEMIAQGFLDALLDLEERMLCSKVCDTDKMIKDDAEATARGYLREAQKRVLRMELQHNNLKIGDEHSKGDPRKQFGLGKMLATDELIDGDENRALGSRQSASGLASKYKDGAKPRGFWA